MAKTWIDVDEYIAAQPAEIKSKLQQLRQVILKAAPGAEETISYQMPAFKLNGVLVYFGAFKDHYSLFPTRSGLIAFEAKLKPYKLSKGTIQFSYNKPIPVKLVTDIVKFRAKENAQKAALKKIKNK